MFFVLIDRAVEGVQSRFGDGESRGTAAWMVFVGVAVDLFSDGIMIGTGSVLDPGLGLLLALSQVTADIPEGFATISGFKSRGVERSRRVLLAALLVPPVLVGATIGYWVVGGRPEVLKLLLPAFTAGTLVTITVEEIVPEAHRQEDARYTALVFVAGFALFTLLSVYFG